MADEVTAERLAEVELFSELSTEERREFADEMRLVRAPVGDVLVAEDDDIAAKFFVLLSGTATVHRAGRHVADLGPGDVIGEAGTTALQPRNATVIVTTPAELAVLMGWDLRSLLERYPAFKAALDALQSSRSGS